MEFLILPGVLLYVLLGWYLVYRDALPRMVKQAYEHIELYSSDEYEVGAGINLSSKLVKGAKLKAVKALVAGCSVG